ncbi:CND11p [Coccidioides immitis H538.4]|uniref:CND11p n=1 Tax=Coccidioides immitis H538.4 TaxID=396776 RepID=A0A0J8U9A3_COCIT|nr:CND11p [Coccidioides immitis H538.4]
METPSLKPCSIAKVAAIRTQCQRAGGTQLFWSPLARFPGPRLAALTNWYEFYYDVILQGKFTEHIQDLHKQYGMKFTVAWAEQSDSDNTWARTYCSDNPLRAACGRPGIL